MKMSAELRPPSLAYPGFRSENTCLGRGLGCLLKALHFEDLSPNELLLNTATKHGSVTQQLPKDADHRFTDSAHLRPVNITSSFVSRSSIAHLPCGKGSRDVSRLFEPVLEWGQKKLYKKKRPLQTQELKQDVSRS